MSDTESILRALRERHHIDPALLESLRTSRAQAEAHIRFWARMMWTLNLGLLGAAALVMGVAIATLIDTPTALPRLVALAVLTLGAAFALAVLHTLQRQRGALAALRQAVSTLWPRTDADPHAD